MVMVVVAVGRGVGLQWMQGRRARRGRLVTAMTTSACKSTMHSAGCWRLERERSSPRAWPRCSASAMGSTSTACVHSGQRERGSAEGGAEREFFSFFLYLVSPALPCALTLLLHGLGWSLGYGCGSALCSRNVDVGVFAQIAASDPSLFFSSRTSFILILCIYPSLLPLLQFIPTAPRRAPSRHCPTQMQARTRARDLDAPTSPDGISSWVRVRFGFGIEFGAFFFLLLFGEFLGRGMRGSPGGMWRALQTMLGAMERVTLGTVRVLGCAMHERWRLRQCPRSSVPSKSGCRRRRVYAGRRCISTCGGPSPGRHVCSFP
ncbi:hypothetical protein C8F04DRAFT_337435 [Mycena alexandri]|uniref:Uncharacterized protein n=1 Tax=Mycena alexandri TaxID=1745969 RepID=A0AAD6S135_9AGAR|nr:hypothetical protein C8F04DRAFT_337435 [Mycena alexandri]